MIQVFDTSSTNVSLNNEYFIYETDTLKITYTFWASHGVMSFAVYNKLDKPIYIDWKNSSYIYNDNKLNYWIDESQTQMSSYYGGYYYKGPLLKPGVIINEGVQESKASTIKLERITFIPPKSNYYKSHFYLFPLEYYRLEASGQSSTTKKDSLDDNTIVYNKLAKEHVVYKKDFSFVDSPLRFRNYLAFSFSENSQQYFFIDNEFYLSSVKEMRYSHYKGKYLGTDKEGNKLYERPFKRKTSFYIMIDPTKSIEYKKKYGK